MVSAAWQKSWEMSCFGDIWGEMQQERLIGWQKWDRMEQPCDGLALKMEIFFGLFRIFTIMLEKNQQIIAGNWSTRLLQFHLQPRFCGQGNFCNFQVFQPASLLGQAEPSQPRGDPGDVSGSMERQQFLVFITFINPKRVFGYFPPFFSFPWCSGISWVPCSALVSCHIPHVSPWTPLKKGKTSFHSSEKETLGSVLNKFPRQTR